MRLFIAEKPAVANDIVKALGGNFTRHDAGLKVITPL
uniref:Toprim domain protein n=1 Tax=Shigella flexneri 4c TaxID=1617964 RepID=A0A0C5PC16_SHIFL|nr:Toprim domain protein [Shigella flexneri 4c]